MPFSLLDSKWTVGPVGSNDQENKGLLNIMFTVPKRIYQGLRGIGLSQTVNQFYQQSIYCGTVITTQLRRTQKWKLHLKLFRATSIFVFFLAEDSLLTVIFYFVSLWPFKEQHLFIILTFSVVSDSKLENKKNLLYQE